LGIFQGEPFEDLFIIKTRHSTKNPYANRKITKFPKRQILVHGIIRALRMNYIIILVNPAGTSNSKTHKQIMREKGLDRHMASAYMIAYRGWRKIHEGIF